MWSRSTAERSVALAVAVAAFVLAPTAQAAPGDLDPSFGTGGIASVSTAAAGPTTSGGTTLADGSVVFASGLSSTFSVSKLTPAGKDDDDFGVGGDVTIDLPGPSEYVVAVAPAPDGKVVASGFMGPYPNSTGVVVRLLPSGELDQSFGGDGIVTLDAAGRVWSGDVEVAPDGSVVVAVDRSDGPTTAIVAKLTEAGDLDTSFSGDGYAIDLDGDPAGPDSTTAIDLTPDGKIVVALGHSSASRPYPFIPAVARLLPNGTVDASFAGDGVAEPTFPSVTSALSLDLELAADGDPFLFAPQPSAAEPPSTLVAKLDASGSLDPSFSADGYTYVQGVGTAGGEVDAEGRALLATSTPDLGIGRGTDVELRRLTPLGAPDPSFSGDGVVSTDPSGFGASEWPRGLELDPQGRILIAAAQIRPSYIVRYLPGPGPMDADADGVGDGADTCPSRFGPGPPGCPLREPTSLTIDYNRSIDDFQGTLSFGVLTPCVNGAVVVLYRKRPGTDRRIGKSPATGEEPTPYPDPQDVRSWGVSALPRPGRYYAVIKPRVLPDFGICTALRSVYLAIHRNGGR